MARRKEEQHQDDDQQQKHPLLVYYNLGRRYRAPGLLLFVMGPFCSCRASSTNWIGASWRQTNSRLSGA
jgi:hypothetical protein